MFIKCIQTWSYSFKQYLVNKRIIITKENGNDVINSSFSFFKLKLFYRFAG